MSDSPSAAYSALLLWGAVLRNEWHGRGHVITTFFLYVVFLAAARFRGSFGNNAKKTRPACRLKIRFWAFRAPMSAKLAPWRGVRLVAVVNFAASKAHILQQKIVASFSFPPNSYQNVFSNAGQIFET
ncbi:hypothetical protein TRVL_08344 [Trypanosoma vivax]|nr:hypothetical protein TRVL_08344 [Trypanosoma vivax]